MKIAAGHKIRHKTAVSNARDGAVGVHVSTEAAAVELVFVATKHAGSGVVAVLKQGCAIGQGHSISLHKQPTPKNSRVRCWVLSEQRTLPNVKRARLEMLQHNMKSMCRCK